MYNVFLILFMVALAGDARAADTIEFPRFRHVDKLQPRPEVALPSKITLLADEDFAPFSFKGLDGKATGISVQLALAACVQLKITCEVKTLPFAALVPALRAKQGDAVLGGPKPDDLVAQGLTNTRPYYLSSGRFLARSGVSFQGVDGKSLAGRRLGVVRGTAHEQFLKKNFGRSSLVVVESSASLFDALRTGGVDLAFADSTAGAFWLKGEDARGCCVAFGGAFFDKTSITRALTLSLRGDDKALQAGFDYALDQLQENGSTAKIFQAYLPLSPL